MLELRVPFGRSMVPGAMINSAGRNLFTSPLVQTRVPARPADESQGAASTTPPDSGPEASGTDESSASPESDAQAAGKQSVNPGEQQAQLRLERAQHQLKMLGALQTKLRLLLSRV